MIPNSIMWLMKLHIYVPCESNCNHTRNGTPSSNVSIHWCVERVCVIVNQESEHVIINYIGIQPQCNWECMNICSSYARCQCWSEWMNWENLAKWTCVDVALFNDNWWVKCDLWFVESYVHLGREAWEKGRLA